MKISVKASSVTLMIEAYRLASETFDHPLHLGVTEAGPPPAGLIKGTAGIATLLAEGIGDTIRYSLTADPVEEARAGRQLLEALGLRERKGLDLIACPSCGRAEIDVIGVARAAQEALESRNLPIQVAVMGCVVNGPGEAREADLGIAAGRKRGHLFIKGKIIRVVPEDEMVAALVEEAEKLVAEGIEARMAAADVGAEAEAEADRQALLENRGDDANHSAAKVEIIRKKMHEDHGDARVGRRVVVVSRRAPRWPSTADPFAAASSSGPGRPPPAVWMQRIDNPARFKLVSPSAPITDNGRTAKPVAAASSASSRLEAATVRLRRRSAASSNSAAWMASSASVTAVVTAARATEVLVPGVAARQDDHSLGQVAGSDLQTERDALQLPVHHPASERGVGPGVELDPNAGRRPTRPPGRRRRRRHRHRPSPG